MTESSPSPRQFCYQYPHPAVSVDCVVFGFEPPTLKLLLIQRAQDPYAHHWALPGGFVEIDEDLDTAARRELEEETHLTHVFLEQLYTFGTPGRDPRERVISVAYFALVPALSHRAKSGSDARDAQWYSWGALPALAFDHQEIVEVAFNRLQSKVRYQPIGFDLLPDRFTLRQLQQLYEAVLQQPLDKRNFRKKLLAMDILEPLDEFEENVAHRAARLHRFDRKRYQQLSKRGFNFEL